MEIDPKNERKQMTFMRAVSFAGEFGFVIALPLVVFVYAGKWLDARYNSKWFVVVGLLISISLSTVWLTRVIRRILDDLKK